MSSRKMGNRLLAEPKATLATAVGTPILRSASPAPAGDDGLRRAAADG